jgi:hypothetical protein
MTVLAKSGDGTGPSATAAESIDADMSEGVKRKVRGDGSKGRALLSFFSPRIVFLRLSPSAFKDFVGRDQCNALVFTTNQLN